MAQHVKPHTDSNLSSGLNPGPWSYGWHCHADSNCNTFVEMTCKLTYPKVAHDILHVAQSYVVILLYPFGQAWWMALTNNLQSWGERSVTVNHAVPLSWYFRRLSFCNNQRSLCFLCSFSNYLILCFWRVGGNNSTYMKRIKSLANQSLS